jgi:hypothetical protein
MICEDNAPLQQKMNQIACFATQTLDWLVGISESLQK